MADGDCASFVASKPCPFCGAALITRFGPREADGGRRAFLYCKTDAAAWELDLLGASPRSDAYDKAMTASRRAASRPLDIQTGRGFKHGIAAAGRAR